MIVSGTFYAQQTLLYELRIVLAALAFEFKPTQDPKLCKWYHQPSVQLKSGLDHGSRNLMYSTQNRTASSVCFKAADTSAHSPPFPPPPPPALGWTVLAVSSPEGPETWRWCLCIIYQVFGHGWVMEEGSSDATGLDVLTPFVSSNNLLFYTQAWSFKACITVFFFF